MLNISFTKPIVDLILLGTVAFCALWLIVDLTVEFFQKRKKS